MQDSEDFYLSRVESDKQHSQDVLKMVLPNDVAVELQSTGRVHSWRYDDVAILIFDLVGFTTFCEQNNPEIMVETLQALVEAFEQVFAKYGLDKVKTVGDAIVAVGGLARPTPEAVKFCVSASFILRDIANALVPSFGLRVGINIGSLVAGTVGKSTIQFDILSKDVNIAFNICDLSESDHIYYPVMHGCGCATM